MLKQGVIPEPFTFAVEGREFVGSFFWDGEYLFPYLNSVDEPSSFFCESIRFAWQFERAKLLESIVSEESFSHPFFSIYYNRDATDWELACGVTVSDEEHTVVCSIPFFKELVLQFAIRCYDTIGRSNCKEFRNLSPAVQNLLSGS